jgi:hypothetical protein
LVADGVEFLVAVAEDLLEEFRREAQVGPFAHAEFQRRGQWFAGLGAESLEHLGGVPSVDVDFVHGYAEAADAPVHLFPEHRPDAGRASPIHGQRERGPADEGQHVAGRCRQNKRTHVGKVQSGKDK